MQKESAAPLSRSAAKRSGVVRLKPNRCSRRNVLQTSNGRSSSAETKLAPTMKATLRVSPRPITPASAPYNRSYPANAQASPTAKPNTAVRAPKRRRAVS